MNIYHNLEKIEYKYNPEKDTHEDGIQVSWAEETLRVALLNAIEKILELELRIDQLQEKSHDHSDRPDYEYW